MNCSASDGDIKDMAELCRVACDFSTVGSGELFQLKTEVTHLP